METILTRFFRRFSSSFSLCACLERLESAYPFRPLERYVAQSIDCTFLLLIVPLPQYLFFTQSAGVAAILNFLTYLILFANLVPISLYVSVELVKV